MNLLSYNNWRKIIAGNTTKTNQATRLLASLLKVFWVLLAQIALKVAIYSRLMNSVLQWSI